MLAGALRLVQLGCCGLLAGAWFADWWALAPVRGAVTPATFIIVQQGVHTHLAIILPALTGVALVSGIGVTLVMGGLLAWYLSRPLNHLSWALREISEGRLETRVTPLMKGRRDEITDLAHDFDLMAVQLQQVTESRKVLLHDVSHELRSPLGRLQAAIGLLRQSPDSFEAFFAICADLS